MTQPTTQQHQRYHVKLEGRRTTISLDFCLAGLLAARLGVAPDDKKANVTVREWLQARTKEDAGGTGLNRRLMRQATIAIADNELSRRCAVWLGADAGGSATKRMPPKVADDEHNKGKFVLYRADHISPPDIIAFGNTIKEVKMEAGQRYTNEEDDKIRAAILMAAIAPKEREQHGGYYIRRCSEKCWTELKNKKGIRPVVSDYDGTWLTRKERINMRKENAGVEWIRSITGQPRRSVNDDEQTPSF